MATPQQNKMKKSWRRCFTTAKGDIGKYKSCLRAALKGKGGSRKRRSSRRRR